MSEIRILALIGQTGADARHITEALRELDPLCATVGHLDEAAELLATVQPNLLVLDVSASGLEPSVLESALSEAAEVAAPPILALRDTPGSDGTPPRDDHYLCRPWRRETLVALAGFLARRHAERGRGSHQHVEPTVEPATEVLKPHPVYENARAYVRGILDAVRTARKPDIQGSRAIAESIHTELLHSNKLVRKVLEPHAPFDLASHSVNVAIIAGRISIGLADPPGDVVSAIQAGLVHDVGMARLPEALLAKVGTLTESELEELRRHPEYGYEIIAAGGAGMEWLARIALQEHERASGQGYPLGLPADSIDPVAQVVAVADVFEALSHPRAYRSPYATFDALEQVVGMQDEYFAPQVVSALVHEISSFPPDSYVQLSTGEICQVVAPNHENLMRPRVRVLWNSDWRRLEDPHLVDLGAHPAITVSRSLLEAELPIG